MNRQRGALLGIVAGLSLLAGAVVLWRGLPAEARITTGAPPATIEQVVAEAARIDGLESLVIQQDGELLTASYFEGADAQRLFHLRSATKSVTSLLIGIAVDQGLLSVDQTLGAILGERVREFGERKANLTVRHLLTMTAGLRWNELGSVDEYNRFRTSPRPLAHYLERPFVATPGTRWAYSSGASHLLSAILSEVTGETAREYAQRVLFEPLEISSFRWDRHNDGHSNGAAGLELRATDSLKIGELLLGRGVWGGRRIVSETWIDESTRGHVETGDAGRYGFQWWVYREPRAFTAEGFAGQVIGVAPDPRVVIVTHCRWRRLRRPSAEQSAEVGRFIQGRVLPFLVARSEDRDSTSEP